MIQSVISICQENVLFNRLRAIWPKGYQRGSLGRVTRTATTSKQAMRKSCLPAGIEPAAFGLPVHCSTT